MFQFMRIVNEIFNEITDSIFQIIIVKLFLTIHNYQYLIDLQIVRKVT